MYRMLTGIGVSALAVCIICAGLYMALLWLPSPRTTPTGRSDPRQPQLVLASVCDDKLVVTASTALASYDLTTLRTTSSQVAAMDRHENDANCDYILTRYYLATGQPDKASSTIDQLQAVLSAGGSYSTLFDPPALNISDLRSILTTVRAQQKSGTTQVSGDDLTKIDEQQ